MPRCIYCRKTEKDTTFLRREHVIPELFGAYENAPTLKGLVCDECNGQVFSPLESRFKEDTAEGILYQQMYKITGSAQVRVRNDKVRATFSSGLGDKFFDDVFPFLDWQDGSWKVVLLPQVHVKQSGGGFHVFLIERLETISAGKRKKIKKQLSDVKPENVSIFVPGNGPEDASEMNKAIQFVRDLGISYKEKGRKFAPVEEAEKKEFVVNMNCTVGSDYGRIIAKIAFNYFAFSAQAAGKEDILFDKSLDNVREYIVGRRDLPVKDVIIDMVQEPVIWDEKKRGMRFIGHVVTFNAEGGNLVSSVSFMGQMVYKVLLGPLPIGLDPDNLGCGHLFSPLDHKILQLTMNPALWGSGFEPGYGLYCKG